jgi:hypothetical protein
MLDNGGFGVELHSYGTTLCSFLKKISENKEYLPKFFPFEKLTWISHRVGHNANREADGMVARCVTLVHCRECHDEF